ncbi:class I SAM-dependent methyltransferase [Portibacter marinus]|uniref:class I SAM-dependent methyltransferase n=1 Tax=Portibacter marinus TaxID=2898660 RepID=UPI001F3FC0FA|nr:class I SAM-dependent methyltransferase [Portibacter marinus]
MSLRRLYYALPPNIRLLLRKVVYAPLDLFGQDQYDSGLKVPPRGLIYTGSGDFKETGERFVSYFKKYGLRPNDNVLDIGSGIGRIALPLCGFLKGQYVGLDIMPQGINWCKKNITSKCDNFEFRLIKAKNDLYNDQGLDAIDIKFPVADNHFNFACLISVFTHMLPDEVEHYLEQIHKSLSSDGICFSTFFIFESPNELKTNNFLEFHMQDARYALMDESVKSANVAYNKTYLWSIFVQKGFDVLDYRPGKWKDILAPDDFQDFVVLKKR